MPHPHGQIYGYCYIPKKIEMELEACGEYRNTAGECLICRMLSEERNFKMKVT